jgi:hypothetical protein
MAFEEVSPPATLATLASCTVEVALPLALNQKWVSYGCRTAGVTKPKWNPIRELWTSTMKADDGVTEAIAITGSGERAIKIRVEWTSADGSARSTSTPRRIVSAVVTAMQWAVRRRASESSPSERQIHLR